MCGTTLRRRPCEPPRHFRQRKSCGDECYRKYQSERVSGLWGNPVVRGRMIYGLLAAANTGDYIERIRAQAQRARAQMQQNWQNPNFRASMRRRPRRFTPDQVRAIRADPRSAKELSAVYGVTYQIILRIRRRVIYTDVD